MKTLPPGARRYVIVVSVFGTAVAAALVHRAAWHDAVREPLFWWMVAFAVAGELAPLRVPFRGDFQWITLSTTFVFVLLLTYGTGVALGAQLVVSVADDVIRRKPWFKTIFNAAQYSIAVAAAGFVLHAVAGGSFDAGLSRIDVVAALAAGGAFYVVNNVLTSGVIAVAHAEPLLDVLRSDLLFQGATSLVLFTQAPLVVAVAERGVWLVPLFAPAIGAVYRAAQTAAERDHRALHDSLTELPNRDHLHAYLDRLLGEDRSAAVAVALVDVDGFGEINSTLGHAVGDALLVRVAERLRTELSDAFCARIGGDEFAVVARAGGAELGHRLQALFAIPFHVDDLPFALEASIGVTTTTGRSEARAVLQQVDVALQVAKRRQTGFEVYRPAIDTRDPRRIALLSELRAAIEEQQFVVHFQPKISLASRAVEGAEALVRWEHPQRGLLPPDEFVPLVESTSLIGPFTLYVARRALRQCAAWRDRGLALSVAINVSPRNLLDREFPEQLAVLLAEAGLPPEALEVEITETAAMEDVGLASSGLGRLRAAGIAVALDDFGTGHSSLTQLHRLPIDTVKIDKSFVFDMASDTNAAGIVATIIDLSHTRSLRVVAEGVESGTAYEQLARLGCDSAQGYHISRPLTAERFGSWLDTSSFAVRLLEASALPR